MRFLLTASLALASVGCSIRGPGALVAGAAKQIPAAPVGGADLSYLLLGAVAISILGIGVSIAAVAWLPVDKRMSLAGLAGFASMLAVSLAIKATLPYLALVVGMCFLLFIALAVYVVIKYRLLSRAAVAFGLDMSAADSEVEAQAVRDRHAADQAARGLQGGVDRIISAVKLSRAKVAL